MCGGGGLTTFRRTKFENATGRDIIVEVYGQAVTPATIPPASFGSVSHGDTDCIPPEHVVAKDAGGEVVARPTEPVCDVWRIEQP